MSDAIPQRKVRAKEKLYGGPESPGAPHHIIEQGAVFYSTVPDEDLPREVVVCEDQADPIRRYADATPEDENVPMSLAEAANADSRVDRALNELRKPENAKDDENWTEAGIARMDAVNRFAGEGAQLSRGDVVAYDPAFCRPEIEEG